MIFNNKNHPKNANFEILAYIPIASEEELLEVKETDLYYTDNIYVAAYLRANEFKLLAIHRCRDKRTDKVFNHFWFGEKEKVKNYVISFHNDIYRNNVNATKFVSGLQAIKKVLNVGKVT